MSNIINNWEEIPEYRAREVEWPILFHKYELSEKLLDEFLTMAELATIVLAQMAQLPVAWQLAYLETI